MTAPPARLLARLRPPVRRKRPGPVGDVPGRGLLWRQLPAYSPLTWRAAWRGAARGLSRRDDPRPRVRRLIRALYRGEHALLVGSGTQALELAIRAAAAGGPCVVALPAYSCYDVAAAAVGAGVRIALYDVDPATLAPDLDSVTATLAEGARIVVVAPLCGVPVDWEAIEHCVAGFGALAVEDAAQGHGAEWRGAPLGSLGRLSVLSFGRGKGWTAGRGGALVTRGGLHTPDGAYVAPAGTGVELAITAAALVQWALGRPGRYGLAAAIPGLHLGETRYRDPEAPRAMSRAAACLLERTLPLAAREASVRRANAAALLASVPAGVRVRAVTAPRDGTPGFLRLPLRLSRGIAGFADARLALRCGVAPGYPTTLAALAPVREGMTRAPGRWPGAEDLARQLVTLPTHSLVSDGERDALVRLLESYQ